MHSGAGKEANLTTPHPDTHTHLSYFGWGDLPFIGASKHTGDVSVGRQGNGVNAPGFFGQQG